MERTLEITITLTSDNTFDVDFYEPESGDSGSVSCHDSGSVNHALWQTENNNLAGEIRSWVEIMREYEEDEEDEP